QNFAAQGVIAMENARLITETREALDQQTATAEVLQVINASPGDLAPVFDAILDKALDLCAAAFGGMYAFDGGRFQLVSQRGMSVELEDALRRGLREDSPREGSGLRRLMDGEAVWQIEDSAAELLEGTIGLRAALVKLGGARTQLGIALRKDGVLLGALQFYRQ